MHGYTYTMPFKKVRGKYYKNPNTSATTQNITDQCTTTDRTPSLVVVVVVVVMFRCKHDRCEGGNHYSTPGSRGEGVIRTNT